MTQAGGPAAINGFLYQILHHLGWIADVKLTGTVIDQALAGDATLVLEPRGGGDARVEQAGVYVVEQYKTRPHGTWSVNEIIHKVLPDLRRAVPEPPARDALYRFVTDGEPGTLESFRLFLAHVHLAATPANLDNQEVYTFGQGLPSTCRALFKCIVETTRSKNERPRADEQAVVFHLLSHLDLNFAVKADQPVGKIERLLCRYVNNHGEERQTRERLVGMLVEELSKGELRLDTKGVDDLLRRVDLDPARLHKLARLSGTMATLVVDRLYREAKYWPTADVRELPDWPADKPVILIAGDSGYGKTWQLGRLVTALANARQIVTWASATKDSAEVQLHRAANDVWQAGLEATDQKTPEALTRRYRELAPESEMPWLTIAVDDIQDVDLAGDLVRRDWKRWGMRLALTVPTKVALSLMMRDDETVHVHWVDRFSVAELDTFLRQKGRSWADLPADLKELLRTPILAGLYAALPCASIQTALWSEYEIFDRFWRRIEIRTHPGDDGILLALADRVLDGKVYPLPRTAWSEIGLTDDAPLLRLSAAGWLLSRTKFGDIAFAHDRLLNWAVAKTLMHKMERGLLSLSELGDRLIQCTASPNAQFSRPLGYVPMDALWLFTTVGERSADAKRLVEQLAASQHYGNGGGDQELYTALLPTLGSRAVPLLLNLLDGFLAGEKDDYHCGLITKALVQLAQQEGVDLTNEVVRLLNSSDPERQSVAIYILTAAPDPCRLDHLWELHKAIDSKADAWHHEYKASIAALRAGVQLDTEWLRQRISDADKEEPVSDLAYLLCNLDHPSASGLWHQTADLLMTKVQPDKPRSLLYCIGRFKDHSKLDFVIDSLGRREDFADGAALATLAVLDPDLAIKRLADVETSSCVMMRDHWLPILLRARPEQTRQRLLEIAVNKTDGRRWLEMLFSERADDLDVAMLQFHLRALETELHARLEEACSSDAHWLFYPLQLFESIAHPDLLAVLHQEAGGELERLIVQIACSRIPYAGMSYDYVLEGARRLLIHIGGDGLSMLVNCELNADHFRGRYCGLKWAMMCPNPTTIRYLAAIASRSIPNDRKENTDTHARQDHFQACRALAALGADHALVKAIWQSDSPGTPSDLVDLRDMSQAMDKAITQRALQVLTANAVVDEDDMVKALTVAWLSADPDLILPVRAVLARTDPASYHARLACIALRQLGDLSAEFTQLASRLMNTKDNQHCATNALLAVGEPGYRLLADHLQQQPVSIWQHEEDSLLRILYDHPSTRSFAVETARGRCRGQHAFDPPYDLAADADEPVLRADILGAAFSTHCTHITNPLRAIRGLAKFDTERAIEAIMHALPHYPAIERILCQLLIRLAPDTAAVRLTDKAIAIDHDSLKRAVGRALRLLDPATVEPLLAERMTDPKRRVCTVTVELAGWLPPQRLADEIGKLADHDTESDVRFAALAALTRQRHEETVQKLFAAFPQASWSRRWSLLLAILTVGDPYLLSNRDDPLWLGHILTDAPNVFAHYAMKILKERQEKEK